MKNSTTGQNKIGRARASEVHRRPESSATQLSAVLGDRQARPRSNWPYLLRPEVLSQASNLNLDAWKQSAGIFPHNGAILCCDTVLRAIETFKTSIDLIDPAQKPIPAPDTRRGEIKILDPSSCSQIHLWSKSKISNLKSKID